MKRGNIHKIVFALFALLLAASCDKEEFAGIPADGEPQKIRFEIAMATATPSGASTRVSTSTDGEYTSVFTAGDQVGLYIVKGDTTRPLLSSGNWVDNVPMTFDGSKWTYDLPAGKDCYPEDLSQLSFYAYYPYNAQLTDPLAISFTVQTDQSTTGFASSYLMMAIKKGVSKSHDPVPLFFSHKLAMVRVNLMDGKEAKDKAPRPADVVTLKGRQLMTSLNLAWSDVSTFGTPTDVKMHYNSADKCWYALVPAQSIATGSELLTFEWTAITTLNHKATKQYALKAGVVQPLDITINANMTPDLDHVYKIGDAWPYIGFDKKGIVFEVSPDGKSGKIFSLNYVYGSVWSTENVVVGANSYENGRLNMETVRVRDNTFAKYPAFQWVHKMNPTGTTYAAGSKGIWYLPGITEMSLFYQNKQDVEKAGMTLKALNLNQHLLFNEVNYVWASNEREGFQKERAYCFVPNDGWISQTSKKYDEWVGTWPIMAF